MVVISLVSDRFVRALGMRGVMGGGMILGLAGLLVMGRIDADTGYGILLLGYSLFGLGLGFVYAPMQTAAMAAMPQAKAGIASGVLAMNRILSGALSLAITASLFHTSCSRRSRRWSQTRSSARTGGRARGPRRRGAFGPGRAGQSARLRRGAITNAVDEAFAFALSNTLWFPVA